MTTTKVFTAIAVLLLGALALGAGCTRVDLSTLDESGRSSDRIERDGATEMRASIDMGAGQLRMRGGAFGALEADYEYSQSSWRPEVTYEVSDQQGALSVRMPSRINLNFMGQNHYLWDVALPSDIPLELSVNMGAGEAVLDLRNMDLRDLEFTLGAGDATVDLSGSPVSDLSADITAGAGAVILKVPSSAGVRVTGIQDGLGTYQADGFVLDGGALVNPAYKSAPVTYEIKLNRGVGDITIVMVD